MASGGFLVNRTEVQPLAVDDEEEGGDPLRLLIVSNHILNFYDGKFLNFGLTVTQELETLDYAYHYAEIGGRLIWRACMNDHQINILGSMTHVHVGRDDISIVTDEVDFDDIVESVRTGRVPGT